MRSPRFPAWRKMVAFAPLLLLLVHLPGQMMLRCRIDGLLRAACCCSAQDGPQSSGPVVSAQDCCDRLVTASVRPPAEPTSRSELGAPLPLPPVGATTLAIAALVSSPEGPAARAGAWRVAPHRGPAIVLLKRSFLI